jgi:hypothetical protein
VRGLIEKVPEMYRQYLKDRIEVLMEKMKGVMNRVSDRVTLEGRKREAEEMIIDKNIGKLKEEITDIRREKEDVVNEAMMDKVRRSERETEKKVSGAMCNVKIFDFNFGEIIQDRVKMVKTLVKGLREHIHSDDMWRFDRIMRRTRVQIMGRIYTVPVREYELITEAHAQLSVVRNCSRSSLRVCVGEGQQLASGGRSAVAGGGGR